MYDCVSGGETGLMSAGYGTECTIGGLNGKWVWPWQTPWGTDCVTLCTPWGWTLQRDGLQYVTLVNS